MTLAKKADRMANWFRSDYYEIGEIKVFKAHFTIEVKHQLAWDSVFWTVQCSGGHWTLHGPGGDSSEYDDEYDEDRDEAVFDHFNDIMDNTYD